MQGDNQYDYCIQKACGGSGDVWTDTSSNAPFQGTFATGPNLSFKAQEWNER